MSSVGSAGSGAPSELWERDSNHCADRLAVEATNRDVASCLLAPTSAPATSIFYRSSDFSSVHFARKKPISIDFCPRRWIFRW